MPSLQFRVLYREFLFRMVDLEALSVDAKGDINKLLGQFAALLILVSTLFAITVAHINRYMTAVELLEYRWTMEHLFIATTMLVVGLFAVLSWDSTFPDRRDVLVLAPLPLNVRTLFWAKVGGLATALCVTVATLNGVSGIFWPAALVPGNGGVLGVARSYLAYWITLLMAGAFIFCCVLTIQGLAAQLPRRYFLRVSALLQMAGFCLFLSVYFLEPSLTTPAAFTAVAQRRALAWLPTYWFFGLFQALNGSPHPALASLGPRAWEGLAVAVCGAATGFSLSYFRTLRKIVEEPDIAPVSRGAHWSARLGNSLATVVTIFSARSLLRSRQHRLLFAFYLGIGFTLVVLSERASPTQQLPESLLFTSLVMTCACVAGARVVFALPLHLRANWIFRLTEARESWEYLRAIRRALFAIGLAPVWIASAATLFYFRPWRLAFAQSLFLGLWGLILAYSCLLGFRKMPFACSYLPGKSNVHMVFLGALGVYLVILKLIEVEQRATPNLKVYTAMLAIFLTAALSLRWLGIALLNSDDATIQFEAHETGEVLVLGLNRDGILPIP